MLACESGILKKGFAGPGNPVLWGSVEASRCVVEATVLVQMCHSHG